MIIMILKSNKFICEKIIMEKNKVILSRVLLRFNLPFRKYPQFGVWSYLIFSPDGIIVFDTGPMFDWGINRKKRKTNNADTIMWTVKKLYPDTPIREIIISHYHYDHSESSAELQKKAFAEFGFCPPIQLHDLDFQNKRFLKFIKTSIHKILTRSGYKDFKIGKLKDQEKLRGTDFLICHSPGHTSGNIALVSHKYKIVIGGWWLDKIRNPLVRLIQNYIIDENKESLSETIKKMRLPGYKYFYYHPQIN
jgi:glyoxylase-like metal-dependent hydrolase (beta-lactamase superfamily II)